MINGEAGKEPIGSQAAPSPLPVPGHEGRHCHHVRPDGSRCRAYALKDSVYCSAHDPRPEVIRRRKEALRRGGKTRVREGLEDWEPIAIEAIGDLRPLLTRTINLVGSGKMHPSVGNAIAGLAGQFAKVSELSDLERRISELEKTREMKG